MWRLLLHTNFVDSSVERGKTGRLKQPWSIWITGLSGAGKSTISKELLRLLWAKGTNCHYLRLDEMRQFLTPNPTFSDEEKRFVYRASVFAAKLLNDHGINAIIDSVDGRGEGRRLARETLVNFGVIAVNCPLDECIRREQSRTDKAEIVDLYQRALQGQLKLAGFGLEYHVEPEPLLEVDSYVLDPVSAAELILTKLELAPSSVQVGSCP